MSAALMHLLDGVAAIAFGAAFIWLAVLAHRQENSARPWREVRNLPEEPLLFKSNNSNKEAL